MAAPAPYVAHVDAFNRTLRILVRDLAARYPRDPTIYRAHKRATTVIAVDPLYVIDSVGPYLFSYRDQIYALERPVEGAAVEAFFLENTFDTELRASVAQEKADLVKYIIPKAKECARTLGPADKAQYKRLVVELLDRYVEYVGARYPAGTRPG